MNILKKTFIEPVAQPLSNLKQVRSIIAVSSCKGGVGKSTIAAYLALELAHRGKRIGLVDCDIYSSAVDVFAFLTDILRTGTWLLIDDWWCYRGDPTLGVRRAFDEWLNDNGRVGVTLYDNFNGFSRAYICYEK